MPGHFTHIYTARRVADLLASGEFKDWPHRTDEHTNAGRRYDPTFCGEVMKEWEKFTSIGAIGPDLFYFSQDYNSDKLRLESDLIMLSLATYYYIDAAKEDDWEPLLVILEEINSESAALLRILIKLSKIWQAFLDSWNETIGQFVTLGTELLDDLTGGILSSLQSALGELKIALVQIVEEELLTFGDIFNAFDTCVTRGWREDSFLWSDMSHYRRSSAMCQALVDQAEELRKGEDGETRFRQFLAFSLGYMTHVGTDVIGHSWVNEQCGGPFRNHPQRHHLIENHIDSWNYKNGGFNRDPSVDPALTPDDPWASTEDYPDLSMSALWFAVQLTPDEPQGKQRPSPLPDDPKERKAALDVDGEMPDWMAEAIVKALIQAYQGHPHPLIFGGDSFQQAIDIGMLGNIFKKLTGDDPLKPFEELQQGIAPTPSFSVPQGFPLPWQIQTMYRIMITFYKFSYNGTWELEKPKRPDFIIYPPASDFTDLVSPPDFSGVDSDNPLVDICEAIAALIEWAVKKIEAAVKLAGDLIKMLLSPATYLIRLGLYDLAMSIWDIAMKTHEVLAHTGFVSPHSEQLYSDGELRLPNEIDLPLITLGSTVDSAFRQALADAIDPLGNLDKSQDAIGVDHPVPDPYYPYYSVFAYNLESDGRISTPPDGYEFHRPWAYPRVSILSTPSGTANINTPTELYDPNKCDANAPAGAFKTLRAGPYPTGTRPDHVFFRLTAPVDPKIRTSYETSITPYQTDLLNEAHLVHPRSDLRFSPLGDPVPFSAYLIGRMANNTNYDTNFNLDSDRGYGYLSWDWIRTNNVQEKEDGGIGSYVTPNVRPEGDTKWLVKNNLPGNQFHEGETEEKVHLGDIGKPELQLKYVDQPTTTLQINVRRSRNKNDNSNSPIK